MKRISHNHGLDEGQGTACNEHPTGDCVIQAYEEKIEDLEGKLDYALMRIGDLTWGLDTRQGGI